MSKDIKLSTRKKILDFQSMLVNEADEISIVTHQDSELFPLKHTFADGIYVRQMSMRPGSIVVGAIHKHLHVWFLLTGHISVVTEDTTEDYIAPCYVVATPGTKRVIYTHTDCRFITVHVTNNTDLVKIENEVIAKDFSDEEISLENIELLKKKINQTKKL